MLDDELKPVPNRREHLTAKGGRFRAVLDVHGCGELYMVGLEDHPTSHAAYSAAELAARGEGWPIFVFNDQCVRVGKDGEPIKVK